MANIRTTDGTSLNFTDWGTGQPLVFCHGWPLSSSAWERQMFFFASRGFRCVAHDRRGMGRSDQPWYGNDMDTYADDLATLIETLNLNEVILVGHSTGGGELVRYMSRHGGSRVAKIALVGAVTPFLLKTASNPDGFPIEVYDGMRAALLKDRGQFFADSAISFFNADAPGSDVSKGLLDSFWLEAMQAGLKGVHDCIKAFSETDFTDDLRQIIVPALVMHGDADRLVPASNSALKASKLLKNARLEIIHGAPHGLFATNHDQVNQALLDFVGTPN